jgi:hypothetical protein
MNDFKGLYDIRDGNQDDKNFILATFLRGLYYGDSWFSLIPKDVFMDNYKHLADQIVSNSIVKVACLKEDKDVILGYSLLGKDLQSINWVYVKSAWRLKGIGKSLVPLNPVSASHLSKLGLTLMNKYFKQTTFNPFRI